MADSVPVSSILPFLWSIIVAWVNAILLARSWVSSWVAIAGLGVCKMLGARLMARFGLVLAVAAGCLTGCQSTNLYLEDLPRELAKVPMPPYVIEPPDILLIDAIRVVPLPPYKIAP